MFHGAAEKFFSVELNGWVIFLLIASWAPKKRSSLSKGVLFHAKELERLFTDHKSVESVEVVLSAVGLLRRVVVGRRQRIQDFKAFKEHRTYILEHDRSLLLGNYGLDRCD